MKSRMLKLGRSGPSIEVVEAGKGREDLDFELLRRRCGRGEEHEQRAAEPGTRGVRAVACSCL